MTASSEQQSCWSSGWRRSSASSRCWPSRRSSRGSRRARSSPRAPEGRACCCKPHGPPAVHAVLRHAGPRCSFDHCTYHKLCCLQNEQVCNATPLVDGKVKGSGSAAVAAPCRAPGCAPAALEAPTLAAPMSEPHPSPIALLPTQVKPSRPPARLFRWPPLPPRSPESSAPACAALAQPRELSPCLCCPCAAQRAQPLPVPPLRSPMRTQSLSKALAKSPLALRPVCALRGGNAPTGGAVQAGHGAGWGLGAAKMNRPLTMAPQPCHRHCQAMACPGTPVASSPPCSARPAMQPAGAAACIAHSWP